MEDVTKACRDLNKLSKNGKIACEMFLEECKKQGLKVLITETYRSQARQTYLYEQGRTRPGQIVTQVKKVGYHNTGNAWDICQNIKGKEYSDNSFFEKCGKIAKSLGIEWGGYWTGFVDKPHFQIPDNWTPPKNKSTTSIQEKNDEELESAVARLIARGSKIDKNIWSSKNTFKLQYAKGLFEKIFLALYEVKSYKEGIDYLVKNRIINTPDIWYNESALKQEKYVRALLIKLSK